MLKSYNKFTKIIFFIICTLLFDSCQVSRFIVYNFAGIKDYKIFPSRTLKNDSIIFYFSQSKTEKIPELKTKSKDKNISFEDYLEINKTVAFLIIQNDTIKYEKYFNGYNKTSITTSFSAAKSIVSILIGCAIDDGLIKSVDEPIINYIPELKNNNLSNVTIKHLLQMTSGIKFNESYFNPIGDASIFYYGRNLRRSISHMKGKSAPGEKFEYISGNTQLLGLILERALKTKTVTQYFQEKLWIPLGMEYEGSWSIDKNNNGLEKTFCCINARANDFAKIGRLYLNKGNWNGKQIVSESWVNESTKIDTTNGSKWYYQYQWWITNKTGNFMANGFLGQFIYVCPSKNLIIVRMGKKEGKIEWWRFLNSIADKY
jgi:CubicO group peptidase (beta-lactamase class C family)